MSDNAVVETEKLNLNSMPTLIETPEQSSETELPTEVVLAILYTQAKRLEKEALAQVLTGKTKKGEVVTFIRMVGVTVDTEKGFVLAAPTEENNAVSIPD